MDATGNLKHTQTYTNIHTGVYVIMIIIRTVSSCFYYVLLLLI